MAERVLAAVRSGRDQLYACSVSCQHMLTPPSRQHMLTFMELALTITEAASGSDPGTRTGRQP